MDEAYNPRVAGTDAIPTHDLLACLPSTTGFPQQNLQMDGGNRWVIAQVNPNQYPNLLSFRSGRELTMQKLSLRIKIDWSDVGWNWAQDAQGPSFPLWIAVILIRQSRDSNYCPRESDMFTRYPDGVPYATGWFNPANPTQYPEPRMKWRQRGEPTVSHVPIRILWQKHLVCDIAFRTQGQVAPYLAATLPNVRTTRTFKVGINMKGRKAVWARASLNEGNRDAALPSQNRVCLVYWSPFFEGGAIQNPDIQFVSRMTLVDT